MSDSIVTTRQLVQSDLEALVQLALDEARRLGASEAEAAISIDSGLSVTVRLGDVETIERTRDRGLGVTVYRGKRKGSASTADLSARAIGETVAKAASIASFTAEDPCAGLPDPDALARGWPELQLHHPWSIDAERARDIALACEAAALEADPRIRNSEGATLATHDNTRVLGNTFGFMGGYSSTLHTLSCVVLAQEDDDMQRDYWYSTARDASDLEEGVAIGERAARRALDRLGARKLSTRTAPVLLVPELARGLIGHFLGAIRGGSQYRRSSFLLGAAGEQVFPDWLSMSERPHLEKALASAPFDSEGVATTDRELVDRGVLTGYLLSSYSARKLGLRTSGNAGGVHNLIVTPGEHDLQSLLSLMGRGLLVSELMGHGVNPVTGDYSRGAAGFWVDNGRICYPVHEITIAGNLKDMYRNIAATGADVDVRGGVRTGSILIDHMTIAGD